MKKLLATSLLFVFNLLLFAQTLPAVSIIPIPVSIVQKTGSFKITNKSMIALTSGDVDAKRVATVLSMAIATPAGFKVPLTNKMTGSGLIKFVLLNSSDKILGSEGYRLSVTPNMVTLSANKPAGLFYGVQTILQLLPNEIESKKLEKNVAWTIPAVEITDYPRFGWRGLMLD